MLFFYLQVSQRNKLQSKKPNKQGKKLAVSFQIIWCAQRVLFYRVNTLRRIENIWIQAARQKCIQINIYDKPKRHIKFQAMSKLSLPDLRALKEIVKKMFTKTKSKSNIKCLHWKLSLSKTTSLRTYELSRRQPTSQWQFGYSYAMCDQSNAISGKFAYDSQVTWTKEREQEKQ